jgi:dihydrofolate synthase / folylpolyglutamate synthase
MMQIEPEYQQVLDYLYSYVDYSLQRSFRYSPEKFDLARMYELVANLGNPQNNYQIFHIAGTKGKGSVSAYCDSVLRAHGYKVGLYTSPHLENFSERIQINGMPISHADIINLVDEIKPIIEAIPRLTTFEITTVLALYYFAKQAADVAVLEVGLGGRLDATNVVTPQICVITSISYDHTNILGNSLTEIATEKAGIIKPGIPVVVAPQKEEARLVITEIARERSAPLFQVGKDFLYSPLSRSITGQTMLVWPKTDQDLVDNYIESGGNQEWEPTRLTIPLLGYHQVVNAATAYATLQIARNGRLPISDSAIRKGFASVSWPGRFEILRQEPPVIIDSAHNRDSALKLRLTLDDYFPGYRVLMVFGASEDKDIDGMFSELMPRVQQVIAVKSLHPRAIDPQVLVDAAHKHGRPARIVPDVSDALHTALNMNDENTLILVTGSIFVVAGARIAWEEIEKESL